MLEEFRGTLNYGIVLKMQEALREAFGGDLAVVARLRIVMERKDVNRPLHKERLTLYASVNRPTYN